MSVMAKQPKEIIQLTHKLVDLSTTNKEESITPPTQEQVSFLMSEFGRRGGKIGGKRRLETMTPEERSKVAKRAAKARWHKSKK